MARAQKGISAYSLFIGSFLSNTGISFIWPLTTIYMHDYLGKSLTVAGLVLFINSLFTMLGTNIGGYLYDNWSHYYTVLIGTILVTLSSAMLIFNHQWPNYAFWLILLGFGNGLIVTAVNSFATMVEGKSPSYVYNVLYFMSNLGLVVGTLMVGFLLHLGISIVFGAATVLYVILLLIVLVAYRGHEQESNIARNYTGGGEYLERASLVRIMTLLALLAIIWIFYEQWQSNIATYMVANHFTVKDYSYMWTVNAILIVLIQPIMTYFDAFLLRHINMRLYVGFFLIGASFLILPFAQHTYAFFVASMALLTIGEIACLPAVATFVNMLAPDSQKGKFQGMVAGAGALGRAIGPFFGAVIIDYATYDKLFLISTIVIWLGTLIFLVINQRLRVKK
ncbi:MFS transporter [Periweissella fabaria]|uniref:Na(+), Li(+), K(+)/H(+) antiporter n=1 Tax=Periweissella fabaria TaxID=546157 RepID=A0ABM8Z3R4_9LACO|nr:MFS transporter [Periweissella fabaria]MCM0596411.1 MFS transporter [Periweissella fabaria]CAH0415861.1 Na(+), Li(+), K(+)/H(+) antiporter [Periweissella fabaria]